LYNWATDHKVLIFRNPFKEFLTIIETTLIEPEVSMETIDDLFWLCQKFESDAYYYSAITTDLQILQGICHGILSDGEVADTEIYKLEEWVIENEHLNSYYPYDEIRSLILSITSDHKIDHEERLLLTAFFHQFADIHTLSTKDHIEEATANTKISALCTSEPNISFDGTIFCFTGVMKRGIRKDIEEKVIQLGGQISDTLTRKTDYLIVGDNGNQAWAFACYGRKVEKALNLRKEGHTIMIVHEFDFSDVLDDTKV